MITREQERKLLEIFHVYDLQGVAKQWTWSFADHSKSTASVIIDHCGICASFSYHTWRGVTRADIMKTYHKFMALENINSAFHYDEENRVRPDWRTYDKGEKVVGYSSLSIKVRVAPCVSDHLLVPGDHRTKAQQAKLYKRKKPRRPTGSFYLSQKQTH